MRLQRGLPALIGPLTGSARFGIMRTNHKSKNASFFFMFFRLFPSGNALEPAGGGGGLLKISE